METDRPVSDKLDTTSINQRRALVIGIDKYENSKNLHGCVPDAINVQHVLQTALNVPAANICTLLSPISTETSLPPYTLPTRATVLQSIQDITEKSRANDFVYIHFSGHGIQAPTVYKKTTDKDESLLFPDGTIIRDIELGVLLDRLADKGVTVLVVLDCCHSGGATRGTKPDGWSARQVPYEFQPGDLEPVEWIGKELFTSTASTLPPLKSEHWFWKGRKYNLLAACQPHELAQEFPIEEGISGLLTYSLLRFLKGLEPTDLATTAYRRLLAAVRRTCQSETNDQFPILFGDDSKSIFGLTSTSISESSEALAHVQLANRGVLTLDRGELDGIVLGDHYQILNNSGRDTGIVVQITKVEPLRAYAGKTVSGSIRAARIGWIARFAGRTQVTRVMVHNPENELQYGGQDALERLQNEWSQCFDNSQPWEFHFGDTPTNANFNIRLNSISIFEIYNAKNFIIPNIPPVSVDSRHMTKMLCQILIHLQRYLSFDKLPRPALQLTPTHRFTIERQHESNETTYTLRYINRAPYKVYITIFELTPDWGIEQIVPGPGEAGYCVEANSEIEPISMMVYIPEALEARGVRRIREKFKMLITIRPHDFSHYKLESLDRHLERGANYRNTHIRRAECDVWEEELVEQFGREELGPQYSYRDANL
ncbi:hypothetical protein BFW01_g7350 [Lasiodiplodia theobromae]|nr:hypothetical protein BFW01_g7350 [Lasiodiplodia theobromae]